MTSSNEAVMAVDAAELELNSSNSSSPSKQAAVPAQVHRRLQLDLSACRAALSSTRISNAAIIKSLESEIESAKLDLQSKAVVIDQHESKINVLEKKCEDLNQQVTSGQALRSTMEEAHSAIQMALQQETDKVSKLERKVRSMQSEVDDIMESLGKVEAERLSMELQLKEVKEDLEHTKDAATVSASNYKAQIDEYNNLMSATTDKNKELEATVGLILADLEGTKQDLREKEETIQTRTDEVEGLTEELAQARTKYDDELHQTRMLETREEKLIIEKKDLLDKIDGLSSTLQNALETSAAKEEELGQVVNDLNEKHQDLTQRNELLVSSQSELDGSIKNLEIELSNKINELTKSMTTIEEMGTTMKEGEDILKSDYEARLLEATLKIKMLEKKESKSSEYEAKIAQMKGKVLTITFLLMTD